MAYFTAVQFSDSGSVDAFQRLRTSSPETLFTVQSQYDANPIKMENGATGTGVAPTWNSNTRMVTISATAGSGTSYTQSYQYFPYEAGKSQFVAITGVVGTAVAGAVKDFGYFDANNGIIFRQNGTSGLQFIKRTSTGGTVDDTSAVSQLNWNVDPMNGTGPSGITLDITKSFILIIDLQFLGMGRVRIGFDIDGVFHLAHQFLNANNLSVPYMQTATLPIQALLTATSTATTATMSFKCAAVQSEGGAFQDLGYEFAIPSTSVTSGNGTRVHAVTIRPKTTFNGITNRELFILNSIDVTVSGANAVFYEAVVGATFSVAPTYADVNTTYSGFEYGTGGTYSSLSSGVVIASGYASSGKAGVTDNTSLHYPITLNRAGATFPMGTLTILVTGIGGTSACAVSVNFTEIR